MTEQRFELTFSDLRQANIRRLPQFKNRKGEPAHSEPDGSDWLLSAWSNAVCGELGEAANLIKKIERGDTTLEESRDDLGRELADVQTYLDILAFRAGIDLGAATIGKFNEVSERVGCDVKLAAIERAAVCNGCGKPLLPENAWMEDGCPCNSPKGCNSPAQADVGEVSASSPEQPPFQVGDVVVARGVDILHARPLTVDGVDFDDFECRWTILLDGHWRNAKDYVVTPAPSPTSAGPSGEPTPGMVAAAKNIGMYCDRQGPEYKKVSAIVSVETMATVINSHLNPELAELRAEIVRLKDDYTVAVNNIGYRSEELVEANREIERLRDERDTEARCNALSIEHLAEAKSIAENNYALYMKATEKCPDCGGHAWDTRLGSNQRFCRLCDMQGRARDAETMEREHRATIADLRQQLATVTAERDGWIESARQFSCNEDFYRNIVHEVGEMFGVASKTSDDGSIQDDVLALKVPELVREAKQQLAITSKAAEAMEWLALNPDRTLIYGFNYSDRKGWCIEGTCFGVYPTPTAAILAARDAGGTNTGEKK